MELDDQLYSRILAFSNQGEKYFDQRQFDKAIAEYEQALSLIPMPQSDWEASTWINTALGDSYFLMKKYEPALNYFYDAYKGPNANDNPFINMRIGQCLFELNNLEKSEDYLLKAFMLDGEKVFRADSNKYLNYLKQKYDL